MEIVMRTNLTLTAASTIGALVLAATVARLRQPLGERLARHGLAGLVQHDAGRGGGGSLQQTCSFILADD